MARRLPDDPTKRRQQVFKRLYQNLEHWKALIEDRGMDPVITDPETGEDIYIGDLLVGLDSLPNRQRQAFELICMQGFTETAARDELLPNSKSSTPVQQYADSGLIRMIARHDDHLTPLPEALSIPLHIRRLIMAALHPLLKRHMENARKDILAQIDSLKLALGQVDEILGLAAVGQAQKESVLNKVSAAPAPPPPPVKTSAPADQEPNQPESNPRPEDKPDLVQMARELAQTG